MNKMTEQTLRKALAFYANPGNWSGIGLHNAMLADQGKVAREALAATEDTAEPIPNPIPLTMAQRVEALELTIISLKHHVNEIDDKLFTHLNPNP